MKPLTNFIRAWKKYGFKETCKKLKYNFVMLSTPESLLQQEIIGYIGSIGGLVLAIVFLLYYRIWYIVFVLGFGIVIQQAQLRGKLKQKQILKDLGNMKHLEDDKQ